MLLLSAAVTFVLDVLRHGEAEPAGAGGDALRALSPAGRESIAQVARELAKEGRRPDRIYSSPLLRALQTAEIVRDAARLTAAIESLDELIAEGDPLDVLAALEARGATEGHVLLATHQPLAGRLAALLTGIEAGFRPGTLVRIECAAGLGPARGRMIRAIHPAPAG